MRKGIHLAGGEAVGFDLSSLIGVVLWSSGASKKPIVGIKLDLLAIRAPQQLVNRTTRALARDIPQSDVNCADCAHHGTSLSEPIEVAVQLGPYVIDTRRVLSDNGFPGVFTGLKDEGTSRPVGSLANSSNPLLGT